MSAIKRLFGRKKDKEPERGREKGSSVNTDTLRASAYESVSPGGLPQTGTYPIKGNASSPSVAGRHSSTTRNRAPSASRHNARRSEIPATLRAVPAPNQSRPQSSPAFNNDATPSFRNSSAPHSFINGPTSAFRNTSSPSNINNTSTNFPNNSAAPNIPMYAALSFHYDNAHDSHNNFSSEPEPTDYAAPVNTEMSSRMNDRNAGVAPGTALTTDEGDTPESRLPSTVSHNRNAERDAETRYSKPEIPFHSRKPSGPRQYNQQSPAMGSASRQYNEEIANRNTSSLTSADLNTPEYSYLSAVYREDIADRNIADNKRKGPIPSQSANQPIAPNSYVSGTNRNPDLNGREVPFQDRDYNRSTMSSNSPMANYSPTPSNTPSFDVMQRKTSIPRKQVANDISPSSSPKQHQRASLHERAMAGTHVDDEVSSIGQSSPSHTRSPSIRNKPLPSPPAGSRSLADGGSYPYNQADGQQPRIVSSSTVKPSLEGIVDLSNTVDTQVVETIAPAVVHEDVTKMIHHVQEEVYTKEIHTHDVYHRIQPVIDVEVLPPRHFLPVEGGGLVEVTAEEVPGRHGNWVIAETASKIPSDEAAPRKTMRFSAAEFDKSWDKKTYTTPEGITRTEEAWVHPPELETGAWATGQTWRMDFGKPDEPINAIKPDSAFHGATASAASEEIERSNRANGRANAGNLPQRASNGSLTSRAAGTGDLPQRTSSLKGSLGAMVEKQRERERHYDQRGAAY